MRLVVADRKVNNNKSNHLAAVHHVEKWTTRNTEQAHALADMAAAQHWLSNPEPTRGVARSIYLGLPPSKELWVGAQQFTTTDVHRLAELLKAQPAHQ